MGNGTSDSKRLQKISNRYLVLKLLFSLLFITLMVVITVYLSDEKFGTEPSQLPSNTISKFKELEFNDDQIKHVKEVFANLDVLNTKKENALYYSIFIALLTVLGGVIGALVNYSQRIVEKRNRYFTFYDCMTLSLAAALLVPLFLHVIGSNIIEKAENDYKFLYVYLGFCVLAAIYSRKFIESVADRAFKTAEDAKTSVEDSIVKQETHQRAQLKREQEAEAKMIAQKLEYEQKLVEQQEKLVQNTEDLKKLHKQEIANTLSGEVRQKLIELIKGFEHISKKLPLDMSAMKAIKGKVESCILTLNNSLDIVKLPRTYGLKGNAYYLLYRVTEDLHYLQEALETINLGLNIKSDNLDISITGHLYFNNACYSALLNQDHTKVIDFLKKAIKLEKSDSDKRIRIAAALNDENLKDYIQFIQEEFKRILDN